MSDGQKISDQAEPLVSNDLLIGLLADIDEVVWCASFEDRQLRYVNAAAERLSGRKLDDLMNDPTGWLSVVHPDDRGDFKGTVDQTEVGRETQCEYRIVSDSGERWLRDRVRVVRSGDETIIIGIAADITEARRADREIRDAQASFHSLVESLPLHLLHKDRGGRRMFANRR